LIGLGLAVLAVVVLMTGISAMSPSSEVVVLTSSDAGGEGLETTVWIVEDQGDLWLRAGNPDSEWLGRVRANPEIALERGDATLRYQAVLVDEDAARERVNELMAEKYGASNSMVSLWGDHSVSIPIRLEPDTAVGAAP
jgi:hypothetical protein